MKNENFRFSKSLERLLCLRLNICHRNMATLESLNFDNLALSKLPLDSEERNYVRTVAGACFSKVPLTPLTNPKLIALSEDALALIDLLPSEAKRSVFAEYFSGSKLLTGSEPAAHCYCGHQFGYFSGQLGDGAAMYLGEIVNKSGERWEIQLKGAGPTPYSRQADGRKVLRSTVREFLCSEAMHYLGVPTTRAGTCITSDSYVVRDMFYDGNPIRERCTTVLRIAPTFIRFGSFEIFKTVDQFTGRRGPSVGRKEVFKQLLDYTIETFFPEIEERYKEDNVQRVKAFFVEVVKRTAQLVAHWQCVGFCHGVLNTDNMSIVGVTIDYGPFGFLDRYDPDHICNSSDDGGRYTYVKQPEICKWNLQKFAETLQTVLPLSDSLPLLDETYQASYDEFYFNKMRKKLGLIKKSLPDDRVLVDDLLKSMEASGADFTATFRHLSSFPMNNESSANSAFLTKLLKLCSPLEELLKANEGAMDSREYQMFLMLMRSNPELLEQLGKGMVAMERVKAKIEISEKLKELTPETKMVRDEAVWNDWLKKYEKRIQSDIENEDTDEKMSQYEKERRETMDSNNPCFILRNHIAQQAIEKAEKGDYSEVVSVLERLKAPYRLLETEKCSAASSGDSTQELCRAPAWSMDLKVS